MYTHMFSLQICIWLRDIAVDERKSSKYTTCDMHIHSFSLPCILSKPTLYGNRTFDPFQLAYGIERFHCSDIKFLNRSFHQIRNIFQPDRVLHLHYTNIGSAILCYLLPQFNEQLQTNFQTKLYIEIGLSLSKKACNKKHSATLNSLNNDLIKINR